MFSASLFVSQNARIRISNFQLKSNFESARNDENSTMSLVEPTIFSKRELFDQIFIENPFIDYTDESLSADLIQAVQNERQSEPSSEEILDKEDIQVIENVQKFRFRIKKSDLERAVKMGKPVEAVQPEEVADADADGLGQMSRQKRRLLLDSAMAELIERADKESTDGEVIRLDMDYDELRSLVQAAEPLDASALPATFQEEYIRRGERGVTTSGRGYQYDETRMQEASDSLLPQGDRRRKHTQRNKYSSSSSFRQKRPGTSSALSIKRKAPHKKLEIPWIWLSKREVSADLLGTFFIGSGMVAAVLAIEWLCIGLVERARRHWRRLQARSLSSGNKFLQSVCHTSYPVVFLLVILCKLFEAYFVWKEERKWRDIERYLQRKQA